MKVDFANVNAHVYVYDGGGGGFFLMCEDFGRMIDNPFPAFTFFSFSF